MDIVYLDKSGMFLLFSEVEEPYSGILETSRNPGNRQKVPASRQGRFDQL